MNETDLNATLERRGQMDVVHSPGVYVLEVETPGAPDTVARHWHRYHDAAPENLYARVAEAEQVLYVGAAKDMYTRLCDHVAAEVRKAAFLEAFPPTGLHSLWQADDADDAFATEFNTARSLSGPTTRTWSDGELL